MKITFATDLEGDPAEMAKEVEVCRIPVALYTAGIKRSFKIKRINTKRKRSTKIKIGIKI